MNSTFIVNFVGKATPATIKQLAAVTHENGGKWLISKVNFIEDSVAAVIKIELPADNASTVKQAFQTYPGLLVEITDATRMSIRVMRSIRSDWMPTIAQGS